MLYQRSRQIEDRLDALLALIQSGRYSTPTLADTLHISIPTVSRGIDALRSRSSHPCHPRKQSVVLRLEQTELIRRDPPGVICEIAKRC